MLGPVLEGKLVTLAPLDRANLENYCRWSNDRQCIRYLLIQHPLTLEQEYAFHDLGLHKVMTSSLVANVASRRAALSAGYRECGCLRRHLYRDGQWHDEWLGEVLRDEWETTWLPAHS